MKKNILTAVVVLAFGFLNAQEARFGVKAGLNLSTLSGNYVKQSQIQPGIVLGGFAAVKLSKEFIFQPELLFSFQGSAYRSYYDFGNVETYQQDNLNLSYLLLPVMAKYYVAKKFSLEVGPQFGFLLAARSNYFSYTDSGNDYVNSKSKNVTDQFKTFDFGINIGGGYDFTDKWGIDLRYNFGLNNAAQNRFGTDFHADNRVLSVTGSYKF
ncbi:porin family protein [Flavobacterium aestivum]|uniref:porin family protein n=1 Tax=Flavobacterium aestivum TaxID=3003257 RepID=UPI002286ADB7|nr:porin family protein [Flavobacterium aestivum]